MAYKEALQLDSIIKQLTPFQRMQVHQYRAGRADSVPDAVVKLQNWAEQNRWKAPLFRVSQDRLSEYWDDSLEKWCQLSAHLYYKRKII